MKLLMLAENQEVLQDKMRLGGEMRRLQPW